MGVCGTVTLSQIRRKDPHSYRPLIDPDSLRKRFQHPTIWNRLEMNDWAGFLECWIRYELKNEEWQEQLIWLPPDVSPSDISLGLTEPVGETG